VVLVAGWRVGGLASWLADGRMASAMGIIGCANDGYGPGWPFPRVLDRTAQAGTTREVEGEGGAILCADSGHERVSQLFLQTVFQAKRSRIVNWQD
jgi:hypothetical protein